MNCVKYLTILVYFERSFAVSREKGDFFLFLICRVCGSKFTCRKVGPGRLPRFCSQACRRERHAQQTRQYQREGRYPRSAPPAAIHARTCVICGSTFRTANNATVTCGTECGHKLAHQTRTAAALARRQRVCEQCGQPFTEKGRSSKQIAAGQRQRFCSRPCRGLSERKPAGQQTPGDEG